MSDNKDTLIALMAQITHVTSVEIDNVPPDKPNASVEGALAFRCRFIDIDGNPRTASMYIVPESYSNEANNDSILALMAELVDYLYQCKNFETFKSKLIQDPQPS